MSSNYKPADGETPRPKMCARCWSEFGEARDMAAEMRSTVSIYQYCEHHETLVVGVFSLKWTLASWSIYGPITEEGARALIGGATADAVRLYGIPSQVETDDDEPRPKPLWDS